MGWMELLVVGVVALIVVGPKDLPVMFQALGKITAKMRRMAREFQSAMHDAADATGAGDVAKDLRSITSPDNLGLNSLRDAAEKFDKWEPGQPQKAMGPETAKLAAQRAETARKQRERAAERQAAKNAQTADNAAPSPEQPSTPAVKAPPPEPAPETDHKAE